MQEVKVPGYGRLSYALKEGHTLSEWILAGYIAGVSQVGPAKLSLDKIAKKIGRALSTTWEARRELEAEGLIERARCDEPGQKRYSTYEFKGCAVKRGYFRLDWFLLSDDEKYKFVDKKTKELLAERPLTVSEALIVALVASFKDGYKGSARTIARTLGLSLRTVNRALKALVEQSEWLYRPEKGKNSYVVAKYVVNGERLRALRKKHRTEKAVVYADVAAKKDREERSRIQKELDAVEKQERALAKDECIMKKVEESPAYIEAKTAHTKALKAWIEACGKEGPESEKATSLYAEYSRREARLDRVIRRLRTIIESGTS